MIKQLASLFHQSKLSQWINILSVTFLLITIVRIIEWSLVSSNHSISGSLYVWELTGLFHDYFASTVLWTIVGLLFFVLSFLSIRISRFLSLSILLTFLLFQLLLVFYFIESLTPLSVSDIYGMSQTQVEFISDIYGFKIIYLLGFVPIILVLVFVFNLINKRVDYRVIKIISITLIALSIGKELVNPINERSFESKLKYHLISNKLYFFMTSWFTYQNDKLANSEEFIPTSEYPFYDESNVIDVLSPFFNESDDPPNIVFIISESLGKQYSGKDARLGSFTPFLDSLAEHSLYWQNVIANAERTFGAIPNLMTGLPEGERGFMNLRWNMPDHLSLPLLLKEQNRYQTGFYCGAWKDFDNMAEYLKFQKFDYILGQQDFDQNSIHHRIVSGEKQYEMENWGAEDYQVFKQSVEFMSNNYDTLIPFFNLYLSTSFHRPYAYTNQSIFDNRAKEVIEKTIDSDQQLDYLKHLTDFGAILYADYSMEYLFEIYKSAGLFENTIFIICGDHSLKFMNDNPRLDKFHVPLLIYSPLLKRSKNFKSVVCQKDVPSALQSLLKNKFNLELPSFSISQTNNLDTLEELSFNNEFVMMSTNKRLTNYVENDVLLSDNILFKIEDNLQIQKMDNQSRLSEFQSKLLRYKNNSNYVCQNNKLLPQAILEKYNSPNYELEYFNDFSITKVQYFKVDKFSNVSYYSEPKSVEILNRKFISILNNLSLNLSNRVRVIIKFNIFSPSGYMPQIIISHENNEVKDKVFILNTNSDYVKPTEKEGWYSIETSYWIEKGDSDSIGAYLFNSEKVVLFLDDLEIEIREF